MNPVSKLVYSNDEEEIIHIYTSLGLFFNGICPTCKKPMKQQIRNDNNEILYICSSDKKKFTRRAGTIFYHMKTNFIVFNKIVYFFSIGFLPRQIFEILRTFGTDFPSLKTIKNFTKTFRSIIHIYVQNTLENTKFCDEVEIDEACLYRIRKGRNGRIAKIIYWIFGLRCRSTGQVVVYPVLYRTRNVIIPLIVKHVIPGAIIYSDRYSVYFNNHTFPPTSALAPHGYRHFGINHSVQFVSKIDKRIHTNTIERTWRTIKEKFRNTKPRVDIDKHISLFMFESWLPKEDRFEAILFLLKQIQDRTL